MCGTHSQLKMRFQCMVCGLCGVFLYLLSFTSAKCPTSVLASLGYVIEHAIWRGWQQAILYTTDLESDCHWALLDLMKCLSVNGIASAVNVKESARVTTFLGIVIFQQPVQPNATNTFATTINQITGFKMNTAAYDWLVMANSVEDLKSVTNALNTTTELRFDQNILVALPDTRVQKILNLDLCNENMNHERNKIDGIHRPQKTDRKFQTNSCRFSKHKVCNETEYEVSYYRNSDRFKNITRYRKYRISDGSNVEIALPLWRSSFLNSNLSRSFRVLSAELPFKRIKQMSESKINIYNNAVNIYVIQVFKMRLNSTLYISFLGISALTKNGPRPSLPSNNTPAYSGAWNPKQSMRFVNAPYPVEARNLMGEMFVAGKCNSSTEGLTKPDELTAAPDLLDNVLDFLVLRLNATLMSRYYGKLGYRSYEGAWTGLLGALMERSVDIALEPVTAMPLHQTDFDFIFPISKTMYNIYIRHQETSAVRDIFLAPFSPKLIACVVCVAVVVSLTMFFISKLTVHVNSRGISCTDAVIWSMGILCQQGSCWRPSNPAAAVLLIVYLLFALVTYNSYAAFITSVLSVRVANVGSLGDVLQSTHIKIGYVRNGADQMYLMSTKDVQLNAFYIRGYSEAENLVTSPEEGLIRAAMQDYAFFSGQQAARTTIRSLSQARGRCALRELPVLSTRAQLAFPLPRGSPYARPVLISLLQLRSGGILPRLEAALVPSMPECEPTSGFASARAADVMSALFVILTGFIAAVLIGFAEFAWNKRMELKRYLERRLRYFTN